MNSGRRLCVRLGEIQQMPLLEYGGNHQKILNLLGNTERFIVAPLLGMVEAGIIVLLYYRPHQTDFSVVINLNTYVAYGSQVTKIPDWS